jgi:hypothetical protein
MAQGASPAECLLDGSSIGHVIEGQPATYCITARDAYANLARSGGEAFDIMLEEVASFHSCPFMHTFTPVHLHPPIHRSGG